MRHSALWVLALAFIGISTAHGQLGPVATIDKGDIVGVEYDGVYNFRGIPYAAPPVGDLRWKAPQPVDAWARSMDCRSFAPIAPQPEYPAQSLYARAPRPQSEDCLYLNVWTESMDADAKRPVMFWIHGGGFTRGTGATDAYDGTALAKKGVVVVTINYRLGVLGFMAHPELSAESENNASGNYAILDMIAALEWVRDNIEVFGGDPDNVTIFGESAGSFAVSALIGTPLAEGLFHRVIGQSGSSLGPMANLASDTDAGLSGESLGLKFQAAAGASSLADLRALSSEQLMAVANEHPEGKNLRFRQVVDGWVFPGSVMEAYLNGTHNDVPVLIGFNRDELSAFVPEFMVPKTMEAYEVAGKEEYGEDWPTVSRLYPVLEVPDIKDAFIHSRTEAGFGLSMYSWAELTQLGDSDAYLYYFTRAPKGTYDSYTGAYHAAEIRYAFDNLHVQPDAYDADDQHLADQLSQYWVNFAKNGTPNGNGLPEWSPYSSEQMEYLELDTNPKAGTNLMREKFEFWAERAQR